MQHDAWFFLGIFVFIFLFWVATGGPSHPIAFAGPTLSAPTPIGGGSYLALPQAPFGIGNSNVQLKNPLDGTGDYTYTPGAGASLPLDGIAFGPPSTYRGSVTISHYVSGAGSSNPSDEYVTVSLSSSAPSPVTISGWTLESEASGASATIPQGTEVPMSGVVEANEPITLNPGDQAIIDSGSSPIGASFRENECIGYFGQFQTFAPPLSNSCPAPSTELQQFYPDYIRDNECINYVKNIPNCTLSITAPPGMSSACANFLQQHLNYNGCVLAHQNDANFKGRTWRVYLGESSALWRTSHEVVKLIDPSDKTVDAFSY